MSLYLDVYEEKTNDASASHADDYSEEFEPQVNVFKDLYASIKRVGEVNALLIQAMSRYPYDLLEAFASVTTSSLSDVLIVDEGKIVYDFNESEYFPRKPVETYRAESTFVYEGEGEPKIRIDY